MPDFLLDAFELSRGNLLNSGVCDARWGDDFGERGVVVSSDVRSLATPGTGGALCPLAEVGAPHEGEVVDSMTVVLGVGVESEFDEEEWVESGAGVS